MNKPHNIIPYRQSLIEKARWLRKNSTPGEIELWKALKNRQLSGYKFERQRSIDRFIVDFYCKELKLAIEVDGISHDYKIEYDEHRQRIIEEFGVSFLRFSEHDAKYHTDGVVEVIKQWVENHA